MGILLSAFFWSYSLMQMPAGWLVDRLGVRMGYSVGFALWSAATVLTGFARGIGSLIAARMALGIGQATSFPASARAVSNWFQDKERGTVTGSYLTGVRLGQALISVAGAVILARYGFKFFFIVIGVLPMVWLLPWTLFLRKWERAEACAPAGGTKGSVPAAISFGRSLSLFRQRSVIGIFLGFFAYDYAWYVYVNWLPSYLMIERKFSARDMGIYSSIPYFAMSAVVLLSGIFSDA
jgi:MFS family permease